MAVAPKHIRVLLPHNTQPDGILFGSQQLTFERDGFSGIDTVF